MAKRIGKYTVITENKPSVLGYASVAGKKEGEGPLAHEFDKIHEDEFLGKETFEKAESELLIVRSLQCSSTFFKSKIKRECRILTFIAIAH